MSILQQQHNFEQQQHNFEQQLLKLKSPIIKKSIKKSSSLSCRINYSLLDLTFKNIYFSKPITCIELKQLIVSHKQCRAKFGITTCLEKCIIKLKGKVIHSSELIGRLKNKMYIEVTIQK